VGAAAVGALSAVFGLLGSWRVDTPAGPSIVGAAGGALASANAAAPLLARRERS
jgi:zinc transport system permease protein